MAGVSHAMSPASVFASTARRSARLFTAAARLAHRPPAGAACASRAAGIHPPVCRARAFAHPGSHASARGLHVSRVRAVADPAVPEPSEAETRAEADEDETRRAGVVHSVEGSLAILEGIGGDIKPGTLLDIGDAGATGVLLSHREPKSFALLYVGGDGETPGAPRLASDESITKPGDAVVVRQGARFHMPPESDVVNRRIGPLGEPLDGGSVPGEADGKFRDAASKTGSGSELFREPPSVEDRKPITTPLVTGVKPIDILTPVGRGQCMLLTGEVGTNLSELGLNAVVAQAKVLGQEGKQSGKNASVRCVYGAVGAAAFDSGANAFAQLKEQGAVDFTVVSCAPDASLAERYAATCAAFAVAEGARGEGKDVLLVLDDFTGLVGFSRDMARLSPQLEMAEDDSEDAPSAEQMVEYEGMIINALLAERRRFLGMTLQRVARLNDKLGGGSLTLLGVMYHEAGAYRGKRASEKNSGTVGEAADDDGDATVVVPALPAGFDDMPEATRKKIEAVIEERKRLAEAAKASRAEKDAALSAAPENDFTQPRPLVEEFMSITDGQVFVESFSREKGWGVSVKDSVSRVGSPGAAGPLTSLNVLQLRLDVMQADDMSVFGGDGAEKDGMRSRSSAIRGFLRQTPGSFAKLSQQTVGLYALQRTKEMSNVNAEEAAAFVAAAVAKAEAEIPEVMRDIDAHPSKKLSAEAQEKLAGLF
jgi:F-type H+-transporting ATPase subunit alpha